MAAEESCFTRILAFESDVEETLAECRDTILSRSASALWALLGNNVDSFRDKLVELMDGYNKENNVAWNAALTFCDLVGVPGSDAYRACDRKSLRALLNLMRRAFAALFGESDSTKRKRQRQELSDEDREVWVRFFSTISRATDSLDLDDTAETLVRIGLRICSKELPEVFAAFAAVKSKRIALLKICLAEVLSAIQRNDVSKENLSWMGSVLRTVTGDHDELCLAFAQRVLDQVEPNTVMIRSKAIEMTQICLLNLSNDRRLELEQFCAQFLVCADKATKRALGCETLAALLASQSVIGLDPSGQTLDAFARACADSVPSVRCAALKAITQVAANRPFILLERNEALLKSAMHSTRTEEKAGVRRWAVKALSCVPTMHDEAFDCVVERCRDTSPSVRKVAVEAIGSFMQRYSSAAKSGFVSAVLPLIGDEEKTVSDAAVLIVASCILSSTLDLRRQVLPFLYLVQSDADEASLEAAFREFASRPDLSSALRSFLSGVVDEVLHSLPNENEAHRATLWSGWLVLSLCADKLPSSKQLSGDFLLQAWSIVSRLLTLSDENDRNNDGEREAHKLQQRVLRVIAHNLDRIEPSKRAELGNGLLNNLAELETPPNICAEAFNVLLQLGGSDMETIRTWALPLKRVCEQWLGSLVGSGASTNANENAEPAKSFGRTECALFMIGEIAMLGFSFDEKSSTAERVDPQVDDPAVLLVQAMASSEYMQSSQSLRAIALLTLGKMCVRDEVLAKKCAPVFVREVCDVSKQATLASNNERARHVAVRVNCLTVLGDLCRRFTNVVEPFIERVSRSLGDSSPLVRKRSLVVLSALMQEEYIRIKSYLFHRILSAVADPDPSVAQCAVYILTKGLLARNPTLFHTHAPSVVFALNGLPRYLARLHEGGASDADEGASTVGVQVRVLRSSLTARFKIYQLILSYLDDAQKLEFTNKLRRDVLGGILEGTLSLDAFNLNVDEESDDDFSATTLTIMDTFHILESEWASPLKSKTLGASAVSDEGDEVIAGEGESAVKRATAKIIDALERKNLADNVIPLLASLYTVASKARSSLVKPILDHVKFLYSNYPQECSSALAPYRDLHALIQLSFKDSKPKHTSSTPAKETPQKKALGSIDENIPQSARSIPPKSAEKKLLDVSEINEDNVENIRLTKDKTPRVTRRAKAHLMHA